MFPFRIPAHQSCVLAWAISHCRIYMDTIQWDAAIRRAFALTLRNLRYQAGISQETLALQAGINRGYMNGMENGRHAPTLVMVSRLLSVLRVTFTEFAVEFERCQRGRKHD